MRPRFPVALALLAAAVAAVPSRPAAGCAVAVPPNSRADVSSESALIVWDAKTKTQHFVRTAAFATTSADLGFLVPTPTQPTIEQADPAVYRTLASATAPRTVTVVKEVGPNFDFGCSTRSTTFASVADATPRAAGVDVLEQKKVGDLDVAVLRADDSNELRKWLANNGYDARPALTEWLKVYVANKWVVSAFKIAADRSVRVPPPTPATGKTPATPNLPAGPNASSTTVRMSFAADRPFFPYREPADQRPAAADAQTPSRLLRVFVLADSRVAGTLGDGKSGDWPGRTVWANKIDPATAGTVTSAAKLPADANREWFLTEFEDAASPRPGTDEVYFSPAADQATVERSPVTVYEYREVPSRQQVLLIAAAVPVLVLIAGLLLWRWRKPAAA